MLATIRNRRGLIAAVDPFDSPEGRLHLVRIEYTDADGVPEDTILWEREHGRDLLEPNALPRVEADPAMEPREFDAIVRAARWSALTPFLHPDGSGKTPETPVSAPFFGAVQVDDFQLVPLLKALQMPRVSLLLADDVGLGKTVEAGLILTELLIRRRVRRVLILTPASLSQQWQREMKTKFALNFDLIDRAQTHSLQRRIGLDANPWRTYPRIIASYYYLRQPDILQQFLATCRVPDAASGGPKAQLPWDLLIVDEAHNLLPSPFGEDNQLVKTLREISPLFEHKLFLTATPHNGHTRSFSGLLEILDPVRFTQTSEFKDAERARVEHVLVRRLKSEINELDSKNGRPNRFAQRFLDSKPLFLSKEERALSHALQEFRTRVKSIIAASQRSEQLAGSFAIEILSKRLLSSPFTFAESWYRFRDGAEGDSMDAAAVRAAQRSLDEDLDDDGEIESRTHHAAKTVGAWLKPILPDLRAQTDAVDHALGRLGLTRLDGALRVPVEDIRFGRLMEVIGQHLLLKKDRRDAKNWRDDERLIIFTEYKTTLDYLNQRLKTEFAEDHETRVRFIYGGRTVAGQLNREEVIEAFNDPEDPIRILIATDVASEGLNLQETARLVFHFDIPWNPSRLEQRNGRLDRHGQARDVTVFHFTSEDDADLKFIGKVVQKVHEIREDLGSMGEVFDSAFERRFLDQEDTDTLIDGMEHDVKKMKGRASVPRAAQDVNGEAYARSLSEFSRHIDLTPDTLRETLEVAMGAGFGYPRLEGPDAKGRMRLAQPIPMKWQSLIDDTLRLERKGTLGPLPSLVFDPQHFVDTSKERAVFRPKPDTALLHLGHPVFHYALSTLARLRFPGAGRRPGDHKASRWIVRTGAVPKGADALVLLTVEELAINELREPFHHWTRTYEIPIANGELGIPLPYKPPSVGGSENANEIDGARHLWEDIEPDLRQFVQDCAGKLTEALRDRLKETGKTAIDEEKDRFRLRLREVEKAMSENTISKLEKERADLIADMRQLSLIDIDRRAQEDRLRDLDAELQRRSSHFKELLDRLKAEQERVISNVLPKRYQLRQAAQVFPVAIEIRLPLVTESDKR
ncbi:MAG: DNA helicase [Acidobacteria bacterium]|nr:DNA helicase [Acidobacteriota bacterium]